MGHPNAARSWHYSIFTVLVLTLGVGFSGPLAFAAQPDCGPGFAKLGALPIPGTIPGFTPFFSPVVLKAEVEKAAEKVPVGTTIMKISEQRSSTWNVEKLIVEGRPQVVAVKRSRQVGEAREETRLLGAMADAFEAQGINTYFHVARPYETGDFHAVYPLFEARDMRELAREATIKISTKKLKHDFDTGGPIPLGTDANVERMWARYSEGIEAAVKGMRKAGYAVEKTKAKSVTTGETYVSGIHVYSRMGTASHEVVSFALRSSDILVTTDGRFVIIDPY